MRAKRKSRSKRRGFIFTIILMGAAVVLAGVGLAWLLVRGFSGGNPDAAQIMVMGVDQREGDRGRSDTLMLVTVDKSKEKAAILSIPRDTRVAIEGNGYDKINHAFAFGGEKLTQSTLEKLLGTKVDHYVMVDISAFKRMIDAVGGVDINVEKRMYYEDPWDDNGGLVIDLYPGEQHLDGQRAMEYVRYRDEEGDVGRIRRQQKFMQALLKEVVSPQILPHLPQLVKELKDTLQTDMSLSELTSFAAMLQQVRRNGVESQILSGTPVYLDGISYWLPDIVKGREQLAQNSNIELSDRARKEGERLAQKYEADMSDEMTSLWQQERQVQATKQKDSKKTAVTNKPATSKTNTKTAPQKDASQTGKQNKQTKKEALKPGDITVRIVNNSGINGAAAEISEALQARGFKVSETVTGDTSAQSQSRIEVPAGSEDLFYGLPFKVVIITGGSNRLTKAELTVGKDYR